MRNPKLDVLRAVAILLVFGCHAEGSLLVTRFGWIGVDLFFVLSGFLVSGLLFREYQQTRTLKAGRFLIRRGFKIYPQFYLLIAVSVGGMYFTGHTLPAKSIAAELAFYQNYSPGLWNYTWSLAVEEHFYLGLALILTWIAARKGGPDKGREDPFSLLPRWIVAVCVAILALRTATWHWHFNDPYFCHIFPTHLRLDSLLVGVLLSYFCAFRPQQTKAFALRFGGWIPMLSIALLAPCSFLLQTDPFMYTVGFTLVSVGFALLLLGTLYPLRPRPLGKAGRAMARLGTISYAFYLWHGLVLFLDDLLRTKMSIPSGFNLMLTFGCSLALAWLTTRLVEQPFLRLRERWFPPCRAPKQDLSASISWIDAAASPSMQV